MGEDKKIGKEITIKGNMCHVMLHKIPYKEIFVVQITIKGNFGLHKEYKRKYGTGYHKNGKIGFKLMNIIEIIAGL
jgi:hypothetical protein